MPKGKSKIAEKGKYFVQNIERLDVSQNGMLPWGKKRRNSTHHKNRRHIAVKSLFQNNAFESTGIALIIIRVRAKHTTRLETIYI